MALVAELNGSPVKMRDLRIVAAQNGIDRCTCTLPSLDGSFFVDIDQAFIVTLDATRLFGGSVKNPSISGIGGETETEVNLGLNALDWNELGLRQVVENLVIPAGSTLKEAATLLLPFLPDVTLDMSVDGPEITEELLFDGVFVDECLETLSKRTGWPRRIDYHKQLSFYEIGSVTAPWNIAPGDSPRNYKGDIRTLKTRLDYANRIIVRFNEAARAAYAYLRITSGNFANDEETVVGNKTYTWKTVLSDTNGYVLIGATAEESLQNLVAAINLAGGAGTIYAASTTENTSVGAYMLNSEMMVARALNTGASGNSIACTTTAADAAWVGEGNVPTATLILGSDAALTNRVTRDDLVEQASVGVYAQIYDAVNVFSVEGAQQIGDALLAASKVVQTTVTYTTYRTGIVPGMVQSINVPSRNLNANCLVTQVVTSMLNEGDLLSYDVTAVTGSVFKGIPWRDTYKKWSGQTSAAQSVSGTITTGGGSTGNRPVYLFQGSAEVWVRRSSGETYIPVSGDASRDGASRYLIDPAERGTTAGVMYVRARSESGGLTIRLCRLSDNAAVGSLYLASPDFTYQPFNVTLAATEDEYELQVYPDNANVDVNVLGYFK